MKYRFDLHASVKPPLDDAQIAANERAARLLGLPDISTLPRPRCQRLAVVGGGPSIGRKVGALRNWRGAVWAVNSAALWCVRNGVDCSLFTIDPMADYDPGIKGAVKRAVIATRAHPHLFELLRGAKVTTFDLPTSELSAGSAPSACLIGTRFGGYTEVTFFGCEGSVPAPPGPSHAYRPPEDYVSGNLIVVEAAGERFLTCPGYLMTSLAIAWAIKHHPRHVRERSGGLLAALVEDIDYEVVGVSPVLAPPNLPRELIQAYEAHINKGSRRDTSHRRPSR